MLGREGWSFDTLAGRGFRYREGDESRLIQIGGGRFVVVIVNLKACVGVPVGVERPVLHRMSMTSSWPE